MSVDNQHSDWVTNGDDEETKAAASSTDNKRSLTVFMSHFLFFKYHRNMGWHSQFCRILLIACFPSPTPAVTMYSLLISLIDILHCKLIKSCLSSKGCLRLWLAYHTHTHTHIATKLGARAVYLSVMCVCTLDQTGLISPCSTNFLVFVTQRECFLRSTVGTLRNNSNLNVSCHGSACHRGCLSSTSWNSIWHIGWAKWHWDSFSRSTSVSSWQCNSTSAPYSSSSTCCCTKRETGEILDLQNVVLFVQSGSSRRKITFTLLNL